MLTYPDHIVKKLSMKSISSIVRLARAGLLAAGLLVVLRPPVGEMPG